MYKVRIILDTKEDVLRTLAVNEQKSLEDLHYAIAKSFDFNGLEMASFYKANEVWEQGEEIPLFNMTEEGEGLSMANCTINTALKKVGDKLIYVYDFLEMWTFYVELVEVLEEEIEEAKVVLEIGKIPEKAPEKEFKSKDILEDFEDEFKDDFQNFESLDDLDFDNF